MNPYDYPIAVLFPKFDWQEKKENFGKMISDIVNSKRKNQNHIQQLLIEIFGRGEPGKCQSLQINGVCSFQCLTAAIEDSLSKEDYTHFKFHFLSHIQKEFQVITEAMKPFIRTDEKVERLYSLHLKLLEENAKEIKSL